MAKNQAVDMLNNPKRSLPERRKEKPFTKKQQAFIQHYVYHDLTNTEAAHRAGYSNPRQIAYVLLHDPRYMNVQMKIRELQEAQQKKYEITFEKVARDLQMIRDRAVEDGSYGAAVTAELGRAKLAGLMVEKKEIGHAAYLGANGAGVGTVVREFVRSCSHTIAHSGTLKIISRSGLETAHSA